MNDDNWHDATSMTSMYQVEMNDRGHTRYRLRPVRSILSSRADRLSGDHGVHEDWVYGRPPDWL